MYVAIAARSECEKCDKGKYLMDPDGTAEGHDEASDCKDCPVLKYGPFKGKEDCYDCDTNTDAVRLERCSGCIPGESKLLNNTCEVCPAGWFAEDSNQASCVKCPSGYYFEVEEKISCLACERGTYGDTKMAINQIQGCKTCDQGRYNSLQGLDQTGVTVPCTACDPGKYMQQVTTSATKASDCENCMSGKFSSASAATEDTTCTDCVAGTYGVTVGADTSSDCIACPKGWFQTDPGMSFCLRCVQGKSQPSARQPDCINCATGKYMGSTRPVDDICLDCPSGRDSGIGSSSCAVCGVGRKKVGDDLDTYTCVDCVAGTVNANAGGIICSDCEIGTFQNEPRQSRCKLCPEGKWNPDTGATSTEQCVSCVPGKYLSSKGASSAASCIDCSPGKASAVRGAASSSVCVSCSPGSYSSKGEIACKNCIMGKYQPSSNSKECLDCGAGEYRGSEDENSDVLAGIICSKCIIGQFRTSDNTVLDVCDLCPKGWSQPSIGQASCLECITGTIQPEPSSSGCIDCPIGWYNDVIKGTSCKKCIVGKHTLGAKAASSCEPCGGGEYGDGEGCAPCALGKYRSVDLDVLKCADCGVGFYSSDTGQANW